MAGTDAKFPLDMSKLQKCAYSQSHLAYLVNEVYDANQCNSGLSSTRRSPSSPASSARP